MKIFCIGRNYADHAKELNNKVPKQPLVFMKPRTAVTYSKEVPYPSFTEELHYELELTLLISKTGKNIAVKNAGDHFSEIGLGIDYTARDIQRICKSKGHSWEIAKAFDNSAALSTFYPKSDYDLSNVKFHLEQNGKTVQQGETKDLLFELNFLIHHVSKYFTLEVGDVVMTGTPAGVGPVKAGDRLKGYLEGKLVLENLVITK